MNRFKEVQFEALFTIATPWGMDVREIYGSMGKAIEAAVAEVAAKTNTAYVFSGLSAIPEAPPKGND
jgi:hypothetical protein